MTKAKAMFDAGLTFSRLEQEVLDEILGIFGMDPESPDAWKFDWYDSSFELKGAAVDVVVTPEMMPKLAAMGFSQCWICYADGTEERHWSF